MIYLLSIIFTFAFVLYSKWQFVEARGGEKSKWHLFGAAMRVILFVIALFPSNWRDILLAAAICVLMFEIGINVIALNQKWNYVGTTAQSDITFGKLKWIVMFIFLAAAIIIRTLNLF